MGVRLDPAALHGSLADPVLGSIGFLNEVMSRHPHAISFAPGAPHPRFVDAIDVERHTERFLEHAGADHRLLLEYGPARGVINDLIAQALSVDHGIDVDGGSVVVTVGAQEAMLLTVRALLRGGDRLAVADPCFPGIVGAARLLDIETVPVPDTADGLELDRLTAACVTARAEGRPIRACYVAPDYANPSGSRMPLPARTALLALAEREDIFLIEDNVYGFTAAPADELPPLLALDRHQRVVHIGSFAKIAAPGLRVGFAVAPQRVGPGAVLADHLATLKSMTTVNTSPLCQAVVGGVLLEHRGSLRELGRSKGHLYRHNLRLLSRALDRDLGHGRPGVRWTPPGGGFFIRVMLPVAADAELLEISARDYGVIWTPMSLFHSDRAGNRVIRLSCSYLDDEQIEEGSARLATLITSACTPTTP